MRSPRIPRRDLLALGTVSPLLSAALAAQNTTFSSETIPSARRAELYSLMGKLPDRHRPIRKEMVSEEERDGYILERWTLDLNGLEPVPAFVARPRTPVGRAPAVLFNHSHGGGYTIGKMEFVDGRSYLQPTPYAKELTDRGYVALCIDHWVFGERSHTTEDETFKAMLWQGRVLWGMMVYDSLRALDVLVDRADVDPQRVATLGISMGSTMAWWLAALDERVKVTVDICCLTDFHTLLARKALRLHGVYYYVPSLLERFTTAQINALIAPRAHLGLAGLKDELTPVEGLDIIDGALQQVYAAAGHPDRWKLLRYDVGHQETAEGRQQILAFLQQFL
jgi:acetyl esterase/lipase